MQEGQETITFTDGTSQSVALPNLGSAGGASFVGFTDAGKSVASVTVNAQTDIIGVDDVRYASSPSAAPEPSQVSMLALLGVGLGGMLLRDRKREAVLQGPLA